VAAAAAERRRFNARAGRGALDDLTNPRDQRMSDGDETPWYAPSHRRGIPRERQAGEEVWRLRHPDGRVQSCELHADSAVGTGVDVLALENGERFFSCRCLTDHHAGYVARALQQDTMRAGWTPPT
jgi:hypothetical protein